MTKLLFLRFFHCHSRPFYLEDGGKTNASLSSLYREPCLVKLTRLLVRFSSRERRKKLGIIYHFNRRGSRWIWHRDKECRFLFFGGKII